MSLKEMLTLSDNIVFAETGQHLNDLQKAILSKTLEGKKYSKIAEEIPCNESYVRKLGSQLWEILSGKSDEKVNKKNFRATMERLQVSIYSNVSKQESVQINSVSVCGEGRHLPKIQNSHSDRSEASDLKQTDTFYQDLSEMPELGYFYDREPELETLATWILQQNCRIIALAGISGIGKTTLAVQLVQQIKNEFEYVIWCSLELSPTLAELQDKLAQLTSVLESSGSPANNNKSLPLIKLLQKYRCLIILDDTQNLFLSGELAGKYKPDCEDYKAFFKQLEKLSHQSCFLLIGWEPPRQLFQVTRKTNPVRMLQLTGLNLTAGREILREYGLAEIENWEMIIERYQGNPFWIKSVATLMQELGESAIELLKNNNLLLPEDVKESLQQQCDRLSDTERQLLSLTSQKGSPVNLAELLENSGIVSSDLLNALQSLLRRCLVEQYETFYSLSPVLGEYWAETQLVPKNSEILH